MLSSKTVQSTAQDESVLFTDKFLIAAHEVTNDSSDRSQLSKMGVASRDATGVSELQVVADRGYCSGIELKACEDAGIRAYVPKPMTSNARAEGRFDKSNFIYIARDDEYQCPAGHRAVYRFTSAERDMPIRRYWRSACTSCAIKDRCTPSKYRRISRWEHEPMLEAVQRRLEQLPDAMKIRKRTIEHVFGTLKHWMGSTHFLTKRLGGVSTEMSLHVLAYNLKRVMKVLGVPQTLQALRLAEG